MVNVKGIVGSTRFGGNTELLVKEALIGAEEIEDVRIDLIHLGKLDIKPCIVCESQKCPPDGALCVIDDDVTRIIYEKLKEADAIVIGAPSYFGDVPSKLKALIDRMRPFAQIEIRLRRKNPLDLKVAGVIAVGDGEFGGQHEVVRSIQIFCMQLGMVIVGGTLLQGGLWDVCGKAKNLGEIASDAKTMNAARNLGRRVAQVASLLKDQSTS
jgi:multimeric flavodoxin WrbA